MVHEIQVSQYKTVPSSIKLGTFDSYGTEKIHFAFGSGWENLAVYATFTAPNGKSVQADVDLDGYADVPAEATAEQAGQGEIVLVGKAEGVNRITVSLYYTVLEHGPVQGAEPAVPTPDLLQQILTLSKDAQKAAKNAEQSAANAVKDATNTVKPFKEEAAQAAAGAALSEKSAAESKVAAQDAAGVAVQAGIAAGNAADAAEKAAGTATGAAGSSALNAESAQKGAQNAQQSATDAAESQRAAKASADAAAKSQKSAATDAKTATDAKVAAAGSAENAAAAAAAAGNAADDAAGSQQAAGASEEKAAASERAAKESEQAAAKSAEAALESKNAAAKSEENAAASAKKAQGVADSLPADYTTAVNEIAKLKTDKADKTELNTVKQKVKSITPDDSTVGEKPWSSKNIVDMLCPPLEESGNPVVCYPVEGYPLGVKAKWEPVQEGSGTPHPAGGGKNLLDVNKCTAIEYKPYGLTATLDGDVFKISGIPNEGVTAKDFYSFAFCTCSQEELRGKGYIITAFIIKGKINNAWGLRTESEDEIAIAAELTPGVNTDIQFRLMVSKDTPTAWEPYENIRPIKGRDSVTVTRCGENLLKFSKQSFKFTQYVGPYAVNLKAGTYCISCGNVAHDGKNDPAIAFTDAKDKITYLFLTQGMKTAFTLERDCTNIYMYTNGYDFHGSAGISATIEDLILVSGTTAPTTYTPYIGATNTLTLPETVYGGEVDAVSGEGQETRKTQTLDGTTNKFTQSGVFWNLPQNSAPGILDSYDTNCSHFPPATFGGNQRKEFIFTTAQLMSKYFPDVNALNAYLAAQYAAGTPVQVCYKRATPAPFTATGAQPLPALAGVNTILTDADSATVTGRADPIKRITDLEDAVASQT